MSDGPNWDSLFRNGQLIWQVVPEHRVMLERFHSFYKNTADEQIFSNKYPGFVDAMQAGYPEDAKPTEASDVDEPKPKKQEEEKKEDAKPEKEKAAHVARKGRPPKSSS